MNNLLNKSLKFDIETCIYKMLVNYLYNWKDKIIVKFNIENCMLHVSTFN